MIIINNSLSVHCCLHSMPFSTVRFLVSPRAETFWQKMRAVFNAHYKDKYNAAGLLKKSNGELGHFLSDVAAMCEQGGGGGGTREQRWWKDSCRKTE